MGKNLPRNKTTAWIKLFTYLSATIILLINNVNQAPYLLSLIGAVVSINYFRQYYLNLKEPFKYRWLSLILETLLIICISFLDRTNISILYFFVCMSETVLFYELTYAIYLTLIFVITTIITAIVQHGLGKNISLLLNVIITYGVSIAFVFGMSYLVRTQLREKEKLARINFELEQTYSQLLENAAATQRLSLENERTSMAREIHDTLAHTLTTLIVQLEVCKKLMALDAARLPQELDKAQHLARSGLTDVKRTIKALRPQAMEGKPFFESVLDFINATMHNTEVHIILNNDLPSDLKLSSALEVALFRLIQESMTNSIRHGQATEISIDMHSKATALIINVSDNGRGCAHITPDFGLQGIRERVNNLGGNVSFASTPGHGFTTKVMIPCKEG
ncbi:MAG: sensor histidine kinase [Peptococcaceae bacterium]|nr:sensor histidine kinase [Peptococcaceae bacterium]